VILVYLTSGLLLGWSLGANDASNAFGTAVGTKMVRFRAAVIIASIFVILGAVLQGSGTTRTLSELGKVNDIAGAFVLALAAGVTVLAMTRFAIPVSTSQAIVGAIIGWNIFTGAHTSTYTLSRIVMTWVLSPVLGALFAMILYVIIKFFTTRIKIHLLRLDAWIRYGLILAGAFGAYSLGANNIANVMGVYVNAIPLDDIHLFGNISISGMHQLFIIGGIAIAAGVITYSRRTMMTIGRSLMKLSAEAAIVVVLAQSLVLFVFSSPELQQALVSIGLPAIPLVPVSSSHAVVGAVIGIGLLKGGRGIRYGILGQIAAGWALTPILSGLLSWVLLFLVKSLINL